MFRGFWSKLCPVAPPDQAHVEEAKEALERIESRTDEIQALAADLREIKKRNNFSAMVDAALRQHAHQGRE